jgi:hypothetical protein
MKKIENPYIRQLLDEKRLLINYVRNDVGDKKGTVVAYIDSEGDLCVGASMVHNSDYHFELHTFDTAINKPAIRVFRNQYPEIDEALDMLRMAFPRIFREACVTKYPGFDREKGIAEAVKNAKNPSWKIHDEDVMDAYTRMVARGRSYFQKEVRVV